MRGRSRLKVTRDRLTRWRERHGGRGVAVPAEFWAEAVDAARVEGVEVTARALRLDRRRLEARIKKEEPGGAAEADDGFVELELEASRFGLSAKTVVRFFGCDGNRIDVELGAGTALDIAALAEVFWRRRP